jgi:hypothetical protein
MLINAKDLKQHNNQLNHGQYDDTKWTRCESHQVSQLNQSVRKEAYLAPKIVLSKEIQVM